MEFMDLVEESMKPIDGHFDNTPEAEDDTFLALYSHGDDIGFNMNGKGQRLIVNLATAIENNSGFRSLVQGAMSLYVQKHGMERENHIAAEKAKHTKKINS